jgi:type 1 glutamine amidotransferase
MELVNERRISLARTVVSAVLVLWIGRAADAVEPIPPNRAAQIREAAPDTARVAPTKPRRVLIFITPAHLMEKDPHKGYCIPYGAAAFEELGKKSGAYEPVVSDDLAMWLPENLQKFDAVVLNNASGAWITPTDADLMKESFRQHGGDANALEQLLRKSLLDYVRNGRGLVGIHYAIGANRHWPEFRALLGGTFTGHPWNEEVGVSVEDSTHPLAAAWSAKEFRIADEIYEYGPPFDRAAVRVLLSLDPARTNMGVPWIKRTDGDFALAWIKSEGRGRVFNTSFGHRTELYWNRQVLQFFLDAVQFATGDLSCATEPRAERPVRNVPGSAPAPGLPGFTTLFNGRDLAGWEGDSKIWRVQDGAIIAETSATTQLKVNNFLVWKDEVEDFELRAKYRLDGGNSGIYYRARKTPADAPGDPIIGTQADFSADGRWTGVIMEYMLREVLAERGERVVIEPDGTKKVAGTLDDREKLLAAVKGTDWNDYQIIAKGGSVKLAINGVTMCELEDRDRKRIGRGWLALQIHVGAPMRVQFKDIFLKRL